MKKLFAFIAVIGMLSLGASTNVFAQDETAEQATVDTTQVAGEVAEEVVEKATPVMKKKLSKVLLFTKL